MLKQFIVTGLVGAVFCVANATRIQAAPETEHWTLIGGWDVSFYPDAKGCQAFALFEQDTAFFIGFDDTDGRRSLNVTLIDQSWTQIKDAEDYSVKVKFGANLAWSLPMDGQVINDYPALSIHMDANSDEAELFVREFREETEMVWTVKDTVLARLTLRGSMKAYDAVLECQNADRSGAPAPVEPIEPVAQAVPTEPLQTGATPDDAALEPLPASD